MCFANTLLLRPHDFGTAARPKWRAAIPSCRRATLDVCGAGAVAIERAAQPTFFPYRVVIISSTLFESLSNVQEYFMFTTRNFTEQVYKPRIAKIVPHHRATP